MSFDAILVASYLGFVAVGIALGGIGRLNPSYIAPLGLMLQFVLRHRITRIALFMTWWWIGWHFLVGVTVR